MADNTLDKVYAKCKGKERIDFESKKWQLSISKYWWVIMMLTAVVTTIIDTSLESIIK